MKKLIVMSAMAVFLFGMAAQAQNTISWNFNTPGDTEGWGTTSTGSLTNGIIVTNAVQGSEVVLTTSDITGGDPGIVTVATNSVPVGEFWDTIEIRLRTLDSNGGSPTTYNESPAIMVINGNVVYSGEAWTKTYEADEWVITSYDISGLISNDITYLRLDPPASETQNFEYDYIKLHTNTNAPPPPVYNYSWEFNTPGDTENWEGNAQVDTLHVGNAVNGSGESVLTATDITGGDPNLNLVGGVLLEPGRYWSAIEIRIRRLDGNAGNPIPWSSAGTLLFLNSGIRSKTIGGSDWVTTSEANNWIVTRYDMSFLGTDNIYGLRIDPFADETLNFEIDYVRLETRSSPVLPAAPVELVHGWEFNTPGDTEGLTAANAITGSEGVLTSADITDADPQVFYNDTFANPALAITPPGPWATLDLRLRQLGGNPGTPGVTSTPFSVSGTLVQINPWTGSTILEPDHIIAVTNEADNWLLLTYDISFLERANLDGLRLDPVGNDETKNFEVDYVRVYSQGTSYDAWSQVVYELTGNDALELEDPDGDTYNNLYEYAFGGDPTNPAEYGFVESGTINDGGIDYFEYVHARRTSFNTGLEYDLQLKDDLVLGSWLGIGDAAVVGTEQVSDDYEAVTNRIEIVDAQKFITVEVTGE